MQTCRRQATEAIGYDLDSCRLLGHTGPADLLAQWTMGLILGAEASGGIELPTNVNRTRGSHCGDFSFASTAEEWYNGLKYGQTEIHC